jgi:TRAP-type C4-dicarboxylate transport system substrate-binding protein
MRMGATTLGMVLAAAIGGGCGSGDEVDKAGTKKREKPVELVLAEHDDGRTHVQAWADAVTRLSGGSVRIRVSTGWRKEDADFEQGTIADVRSGKVALAKVSVRAFDEVGVTTFQPLVAPLLIDSAPLERRVLTGDLGRAALAGTEKLGLVGLALFPTQMRRPVGLTRPLVTADDYRGARVYAREGLVAEATLNALGARPVHAATGVWSRSVDGGEVSAAAVRGDRTAARRAAGFTANVVLWPHPVSIVVNRKVFDDLSTNQQDALRKAGAEAFGEEAQLVSRLAAEDAEVVCRLGTKLVAASPQERAALRDAVQPAYDEIGRTAANRKALESIRAMKGDAPPESLACSSAGSPAKPAPAVAELQGEFRARLTEEELAASPLLMDSAELNDGNWGELRLEFDGDEVRTAQRNALSQRQLTGRFTTEGDTLQMTFDELGETFAFRWSLYRGTLKLERDAELGVAPTPFVAKPWRRVR